MIPTSNLTDTDMQVRYAAMQTLIKQGSAALPALIAALEPTYEDEMRWRATASLAWIGDPAAISAIVRASAGAEYALKYNCIWGLGQIGDRAAVPALLEIVTADETELPDVRYNAALALLRLGERAYLESAIDSDNEGTYRVAAAALAAAGWL